MNEREELARLKAEQARLELELSRMSGRLRSLEQALDGAATRTVPMAPPPTPQAIPQPKPPASQETAAPSSPRSEVLHKPPPIRVPEPAAAHAPPPAPPPLKLRVEQSPAAELAAAPPSKPEPPHSSSPPTVSPAKDQSFEMRLGTYWFVRIGVVMVLTALVFFGHLAYENYISRLGPGGKVFLLHLASIGF